MFKNIAVLLRGHIRTWEYNAPVMFDFFDKIGVNVDYYIATWKTPNVRQRKILQAFDQANKKFKQLLLVNYQEGSYTSWSGPAHLSLQMMPYMRQQHRKTPYDVVFDTRPDVLAKLVKDIPITVNPDTLYSTAWTNLVDCRGDRNIGVMDHMLVSKFNVFEAMCDRITINSRDTRECHVEILSWAKSHGFSVSNCTPWMNTAMIRPADVVRTPNAFTMFTPQLQINESQLNWVDCTVEQRVAIMKEQDIESYDYITNNSFISIENLSDSTLQELDHGSKSS